jgi:hypothetical protein
MAKAWIIFGSLAIVALVGAVAVTAGYDGFTTLLSSSSTPSVDGSQTRTSKAAPSGQPEAGQPGAIEPLPSPPAAQLPAPAPPASASTSADTTGSVPSAQGGGRVTAADILVPDADGANRTALTAEEKDAVARGLKELGITAATETSPSQPEQAATAELNRKALAGSVAEPARSKQLQAQNRQ